MKSYTTLAQCEKKEMRPLVRRGGNKDHAHFVLFKKCRVVLFPHFLKQ
jgi:hypothetical protein